MQKVKQQKYHEFLEKQKEEWRKKREVLKAELLKKRQREAADDLNNKSPMETALTAQISDSHTLSQKVDPQSPTVLVQDGSPSKPAAAAPLPGPGAYSLPASLSSPEKIQGSYNAISFGFHGSPPKPSKHIPSKLGPGAYNTIPVLKKGPAFSFGERFDGIPLEHPKLLARRKLVEREQHEPQMMPPVSYMGKSPGVKMSPPPKDRKKLEDLIGPGSYQPAIADYSPKITFAGKRAKSINTVSADLPGPGEYKPEAAINYLFPPLAKTISLATNQTKQGNDVPGPGAYRPKLFDTIPSCK